MNSDPRPQTGREQAQFVFDEWDHRARTLDVTGLLERLAFVVGQGGPSGGAVDARALLSGPGVAAWGQWRRAPATPTGSCAGRSDPHRPVVLDTRQPATGAVNDEGRRWRGEAPPDHPPNCAPRCRALRPGRPSQYRTVGEFSVPGQFAIFPIDRFVIERLGRLTVQGASQSGRSGVVREANFRPIGSDHDRCRVLQ